MCCRRTKLTKDHPDRGRAASSIAEDGIGLLIRGRDGQLRKLVNDPVAEAAAIAEVEADNAHIRAGRS